jgi:hypothetical protein
MDDPKKRLLIRLYFTHLPLHPALGLLAVGLVFAWAGAGYWILVAGVLYSGAIGALAYSQPADRQIDDWLSADAAKLVQKAFKMLDLEPADIESGKPFQIAGPLLHTTPLVGKEHIRFRKGRNGTYRLSVNKVLILLPTKNYLGVFHCIYDSIRDQIFHSVATEYAYRNVVAIKYGEEAEVFKGDQQNLLTTRDGKPFVPSQYFSISISNGETFGVPVRAHDAATRAPGDPPLTDLDRTVRALKKLLQPKFEAT